MSDDLPPFDPEWLEVEKAMGGREVLTLSSAQASREQFRIMFTAMGAAMPGPSPSTIKEEVIPISATQYIKIYTPLAALSHAKTTNSLLPVGLYIHCGGFYAGSVELEDGLCRQIVSGSPIILFSPSYRLAPEHPYPAGQNDVFAAYEWMHAHAAAYGGDPTRKAVMGGSAGGALTGSVCVRYAADPEMRAVAAIPAAMGSCHWEAMPEAYRERLEPERYRDSPMITMESLKQVREWLQADPRDPLHSPLVHPDVKHLGKMYIPACEKDPTYQESLFFYEECKKQGVDVEFKVWKGLPHFFWGIATMQRSKEFMAVWCEKLNEMLGVDGGVGAKMEG